MFEGKPAAAASSIKRSHLENEISPKEVELDASWTSSSLGHSWNAHPSIVLRYLLQTTRSERGAFYKRQLFDDFELIGESNTCEGGAELECSLADSLEVFVPDDALEGFAFGERQLFDDCELIGESDTREDGAVCECCHS